MGHEPGGGGDRSAPAGRRRHEPPRYRRRAGRVVRREQIGRFQEVRAAFPGVTAHLANSAGTLRFPEARFDAVRCGVALYGLSPFGDDPAGHGLEPGLSWRSYVAQARELAPGESTGYGRLFVAEQRARIGIVPVGYADGFRRGLTGTEVLVGTRGGVGSSGRSRWTRWPSSSGTSRRGRR